MEIVNSIAGLLGISSGSLIVLSVFAVALLVVLFAIRMFIKITTRIFAMGCVTILGLVLGLYILFIVLK
jgi:hypothetical protein